MKILIERILTTAVLVITPGFQQLMICLAICEIPQTTQLHFNSVVSNDNSTRYLLHCAEDRILYPLGDHNDVYCDLDGIWHRSDGYKQEVDMTNVQCLHMCKDPYIENGDYRSDDQYDLKHKTPQPIAIKSSGRTYYIPTAQIILTCNEGFNLSSSAGATCGKDGQWMPPLASCLTQKDLEAENEQLDDTDPIDYKIIIIIVSVVAVLLTLVVMLTICIRAKWRVVCRKRRTPTSHPDDINYPHGYTQLGSGTMLPSYAEATDDYEYRENYSNYSVYRPTTALTDYRQLSSMESSSRGESESLSASSHRHSLFSGSSANYRYVGDDTSDVLLQGDHLSMSDTSTLVTVNTYESHTASNPSLNNNSRRGIAGSMNSNAATSMDDAPLIVRDNEVEDVAVQPTAC